MGVLGCLCGVERSGTGSARYSGYVSVIPISCPQGLTAADVSLESMKELALFAEYSAAAYCDENLESPGTKVRCQKGNCPTVEKADTKTLTEFHGCVSTRSLDK